MQGFDQGGAVLTVESPDLEIVHRHRPSGPTETRMRGFLCMAALPFANTIDAQTDEPRATCENQCKKHACASGLEFAAPPNNAHHSATRHIALFRVVTVSSPTMERMER